jgi:hypothetical protein
MIEISGRTGCVAAMHAQIPGLLRAGTKHDLWLLPV